MQGRKIPNDTWKKFPRVLAQVGGSITAAATQFGVDPRSVYYHMRRNPAFASKIQEVYDTTVVPILEQQMYALALSKDYRAMRFILANRSPRRWNTEFVLRTELEVELAREVKRIEDGEKKRKPVCKWMSLRELILKHIYEQHLYSGQPIPDILTIDTREEKKYFESYRSHREAWLKEHPDGRDVGE